MAQKPTNQQIIDRWKDEPAPLLAALHAFQDRDGYLSDDAIKATAAGLKIPIADLYGTVTFYHHFARDPGGLQRPRVCTGPVCKLHGADEVLSDLAARGATAMPCAGRCDDPIPVLRGARTYAGVTARSLSESPSPVPPPNPGQVEECVFASIRAPDRRRLKGYERTGGYSGLVNAVQGLSPEEVVEIVKDSGLAGRGGAGFPTGVKWKAVADASRHPKSIVCNADEGEPGCFKDRAIMDYDPHAVIEGMTLGAYATGASHGFIYLRYEYPETLALLEHALNEARATGYLGISILGTDFNFDIYVRRGAGAYICGEEGSLLNSLEGKHPFPRNRPPFPVTHGYNDLPTAVNNVETLASIPHIFELGPDWYKSLGMNGQAGTKIISLSGDIQRPGNYEVPLGLPLATLLNEWAGGPRTGRSIQAVTMAGLSGGFLAGDDLIVTLDEPSIRAKGSFLGAGGIMVFDDTRDMVSIAHDAMEFFAEESCGKCFPCRIGTQRLTERLSGEAGPRKIGEWIDEVTDIGRTMKAVSACGLGLAAPLITESLMRYFPAEVERTVETTRRS